MDVYFTFQLSWTNPALSFILFHLSFNTFIIHSVSYIILHFHHLFYFIYLIEVGGWSDTMITDLWLRGGQCTQNIDSAVPVNYVTTIS